MKMWFNNGLIRDDYGNEIPVTPALRKLDNFLKEIVIKRIDGNKILISQGPSKDKVME